MEETVIPNDERCESGEMSSSVAEEFIQKAIEELNTGKEQAFHSERSVLHDTCEDPQRIAANISLDDVLSKKQKESQRRKHAPRKEKRECVKNTVAHLENGKRAFYDLNASNGEKTLILIFAFLLENGLLTRTGQLIFFIDGAADLRLAIQSLFEGRCSFKIILDWFHLEKKCKERLSMALKGKVVRNTVLDHLLPLLWHGHIDAALAYVQGLNEKSIKNHEELRRLVGSIERNRTYLPCYALRQKLGLRVSSNRGEKANDLAVSTRQKHHGMSWSSSGSTGLATITTLHLNSELSDWLFHRNILFQFRAPKEEAA